MILFAPLRGTVASDHLDLIRGLAAFAVLVFHLRGTFFADLGPGSHPILSVFYLLTALGLQAVMVFFVLSGFLIGASVLRAWHERRWRWRPYLIARFTRLYLVLIPALILGFAWDRSGLALFGSRGIYAGAVPNASIFSPVAARLGLLTMLGNLTFLQRVLTSTFGSNGPLWSLANEFWYYILFPLLIIAIRGRRARAQIGAALAALGLIFFVGADITRLFAIWLAGAALNFLPLHAHWRTKPMGIAALAVFWAAIAASNGTQIIHGSYPRELLTGAATAILIYAALQNRAPSRNGPYARIARRLAGFSYSLYLAQLPAIVFLKALIAPAERWPVGAASLTAFTALAAAIVLYAALIAHFTEARNDQVRRWVTERVGRMLDRRFAI